MTLSRACPTTCEPDRMAPQPCFGFGGAPAVALARLTEVARPGDVVFLGLDLELGRRHGLPNPGAASWIRRETALMAPWTLACARGCHDGGILVPDDPATAAGDLARLCERVARLGFRPVVVGCDHTVSLPGVLGVVASRPEPRDLTYLCFDAHFDLGLHQPSPDLHNGNFVNVLRSAPWHLPVVNLGGRSWSAWLPEYQDVPRFTCLQGGAQRLSVAAMIEALEGLRGRPVYVSLDADVLDPAQAPQVCCPEPFGMSLEDLFALCSWIGASCEVLGADLSELRAQSGGLGAEAGLMRCLHALFPKGALL